MLSRAVLFTPPGFWLALGLASAKLETFESSITCLLVLTDVAASAESPDSKQSDKCKLSCNCRYHAELLSGQGSQQGMPLGHAYASHV